MDIREWDFQRGYIEVNLDNILNNMDQMKKFLQIVIIFLYNYD